MLQVHTILVPCDFSSSSKRAVHVALELAERVGAAVHLLFAEVLHADAQASGDDPQETLKQRLLQDLDPHVPVEPVVTRNVAAAPAIVAYAEEHPVDLIVMGTHGRRGISRMLLGSTAEEVVRTAPCPVLTIRGREDTAPEAGIAVERILVPVDFSRHAREALGHARALAGLFGARIDLLHVVEEQLHPAFYNIQVQSIYDLVPDLDQKAEAEMRRFFEETPGPDVEAAYHVRKGQAARQITVFAEEEGISLIVMSTHGLRGLEHFLIGSVAEKVVRRAPCPVLTLKSFGPSLLSEAERNAAARNAS